MDKALDRVLKDINRDISKVQETADLMRREIGSTTNDQGLNDSLKAINNVLRSQKIKLDTIEELLQVVGERGSQTTREDPDPPTSGKRSGSTKT
ncbi:hypothetical protein FRC08_018793 [Ceratobasidium sp. 394]|nr:hypothetical protein FRC08_018793 [Ceratobasidium sp. 394]